MTQISLDAFMEYVDEYLVGGRCFMDDFISDETCDKAYADTMLHVFVKLNDEEIKIFISTILSDYIDSIRSAA